MNTWIKDLDINAKTNMVALSNFDDTNCALPSITK